jgi:hypothetical protein
LSLWSACPEETSRPAARLHLRIADHKRPCQQFRNTQARTEPSTVNGSAVMLPWAEKPTPLGAGEVTFGKPFAAAEREAS